MTTKLTVFNHGPHAVKVLRGPHPQVIESTEIAIGRVAPGEAQDFHIWSEDLRIEEEDGYA